MVVKIIPREITSVNHNLDQLHPVLQKIYLTRGINDIEDLNCELNKLIPFNLLSNIDKATDLIYSHMVKNSKILIIGDFDGDGATSTSLAVDFFRQLGVNISYLVPNRFDYGYGLSVPLVHEAAKKEPNLLITVDSGIACLAGVKAAKELNIDVLVTDHHLPGENLPEADCIVNPNLKGDKFPSKNMAGVGVIFYVLLALRSKLREKNWFILNNKPELNMGQFLDLVALGTITDVVPLDYNNRILVKNGLNRIQAGVCRVGIKALLKISKRNYKTITSSDLGFSVGPRLNAAGRLNDMSLGIACLLAEDPMKAFTMAESLDALNHERKMIERDMKLEALDIIKKLDLSLDNHESLPLAFCLYQQNWHQGVIGIVAARIKELYHRPVIVFAEDNEEYIKGSCRSIEGVHMRDVLQNIASQNPDLIPKFGGHAMAAGLSIRKADFNLFNQLFVAEIGKTLCHEDIYGKYCTDGALEDRDLSLDFAELLKQHGPWGQHFPEPQFSGEFIVSEQKVLAQNHLSLRLKPSNTDYKGTSFDGIIFNCSEAKWFNDKFFKINIVYKLDINEYNNQRKVQLLIDYLEHVC